MKLLLALLGMGVVGLACSPAGLGSDAADETSRARRPSDTTYKFCLITHTLGVELQAAGDRVGPVVGALERFLEDDAKTLAQNLPDLEYGNGVSVSEANLKGYAGDMVSVARHYSENTLAGLDAGSIFNADILIAVFNPMGEVLQGCIYWA